MSATPILVYSSKRKRKPLSFTIDHKHYALASKLIDAIFANKRSKVVVDRSRFSYIPSNGTKKMVIRLKRS